MNQKKWNAFPKYIQILNIAAEFSRGKHWLQKKSELTHCLDRAFDLIDTTLNDSKWHTSGLRELLRFREQLANFYIQRDKNHFFQLYKTLLLFTPQSARVKN